MRTKQTRRSYRCGRAAIIDVRPSTQRGHIVTVGLRLLRPEGWFGPRVSWWTYQQCRCSTSDAANSTHEWGI